MMYELDARFHEVKVPNYRLDNTKIFEIRFRVSRWMKQDLQRHCEMHDVPVSHVLRSCIRDILQEELNK